MDREEIVDFLTNNEMPDKLDQISLCLGHESIETTQDYLGVEQDFTDAPCDKLKLRV